MSFCPFLVSINARVNKKKILQPK